MRSLSSGYAASAQRSITGAGSLVSADENAEKDKSSILPSVKPDPSRKNRIVAPPPAQYVGAADSPSKVDMNQGSRSTEQRAKLVYAYQATGEGELSLDEGQEISILDPDGKHSHWSLSS